MFDMSNDSHLFRTREQLEDEGWELHGNVFEKNGRQFLPLYEAKMIHQFDHRWATYDGVETRSLTLTEKNDPNFLTIGRYWVSATTVATKMADMGWKREWLLGCRDICRNTDERTVVGGVFPLSGVGNNLPVWTVADRHVEYLAELLSSYACDFPARFKVGGTHLNYFIAEQLPILPPEIFERFCPWDTEISLSKWFLPRILELTYTTYDLASFAVDCGFDGSPFRWDEERRFLLRCELDAAFFHLYLPSNSDGMWKKTEHETEVDLRVLTDAFATPRDAVEYIMETFPIVKRKDEAAFGEYRTKRVILEIYDELQQASATDKVYQTRLAPPPGDKVCQHTLSA
jgi:hypothetical protein